MTTCSRRQFLQTLAIGTVLTIPTLDLLAQADTRHQWRCPILMYHYISQPPEDANRYLRDLAVPPETFAQHLDFLREAGFTTITMRQWWQIMINQAEAPEKPIVLTFDDGYWDAYAHASRLMLERDMRGVFYVVSDFLNQPGFLTSEQVGILHSQGFEIGNHSQTHSDMSYMNSDAQRTEIQTAHDVIAGITGQAPTNFCYPLGRFNRLSAPVLRDLGYTTAVTTQHTTVHRGDRPHHVGRVRVRSTTTTEQLGWLVNPA